MSKFGKKYKGGKVRWWFKCKKESGKEEELYIGSMIKGIKRQERQNE